MPDRFYAGQQDYIEQLNLLATQVDQASGTTGVSSFNGRTNAVTLTTLDVTTALTFTPYNATNPAGYITVAALADYATENNPIFTGNVEVPTLTTTSKTVMAANALFVHKKLVAGPGVSSVTYSSNISLNCADDNFFSIPLNGNTICTLINAVDGQRITLRLTQDATGNRFFSFAANTVRFGAKITSLAAISSTAGAQTYIGLIYNTGKSRFDVVALSEGYV